MGGWMRVKMNQLLIACACALALAVAPYSAQTPEQLEQIKKFCMKAFSKDDGTIDWVMVEFCIGQQIVALKKVEKR